MKEMEEAEQRKDNKKISRLVQEYNNFKKNNLPNFVFNLERETEKYSKYFLIH